MPSVQLKSIESFSSEDLNHPALNLLKPSNKKWKCCEAGEKIAFVVVRLEQPVQITGIDIGNEHSAFIEVLVARSGPTNPNFTELLLSTKFMNPVESRNSTSPNRVQFFNKSALLPTAAEEKWDLVKIVCTQPFNARVRYGLTFVALHTTGGEKKDKSLVPERFQQQIKDEAEKGNAANVLSFGRFKLREDSPDSDGGGGAGGSSDAFARWKERLKPNALNVTTSVSALMRDSATAEGARRSIPEPGSVRSVIPSRPKPQQFDSSDEEVKLSHKSYDKPTKANRNSVAVLYDEEDQIPDKRLNHSVAREQAAAQSHGQPKISRQPDGPSKNPSKLHDTGSSKFKEFLDFTGQSMGRDSQRASEEKRKPPTKIENSQLSTSAHSSSGNTTHVRTPLLTEKQTPPRKRSSSPSTAETSKESRSPLNKKPKPFAAVTNLAEEAKRTVQYKPFEKLLENVVLVISGIQNPERGAIRSQALAMGAKYKPDWDSTCTHLICAYKNTPKYNQVRGKGKIIKKDWITSCYNNRKRFSWRKFAMDTDEANEPDSEDEIVDVANKPHEPAAAAWAAGDEEYPVMLYELEASDSEDGAGARAHASYDLSTEDEGEPNGDASTGGMEFFKGKMFYLDSELDAVDIIKLEKCIEAYKGIIGKVLQDVDYVITRNKRKLPPSSRAKLVKPLWIYECNDMECLIPINRYEL